MAPRKETIVGLIQARMSSRRLPGKVLKPLAGRAMVEHIYAAAAEALSPENVIVATSIHPSDDELERFCRLHGMKVFRGSLENVVERLQGALKQTEASAFFRICADSPFYDPAVMNLAKEIYARKEVDLVTNVFPRSFPKGRSVELARRESFLALDAAELGMEEREHVFAHYYKNPGRFRVENFSAAINYSNLNLCVDTPEDWDRAERFLMKNRNAPHLFSNEELAAALLGGGA